MLAKVAATLWQEGVFDFLELFVPATASLSEADSWAWYDGVLVLHGPHSECGFNFADSRLSESNRVVLAQLDDMVRLMKPMGVVLHPGCGGSQEEFESQVKWIKAATPDLHKVLLIENKPMIALDGRRCLGASPEELSRCLAVAECGFCFDIRHAVAYAAAAEKEWLEVAETFFSFNPALFHIADGKIEERVDSHDHFGAGNIDWRSLAPAWSPESLLTIECRKDPALRLVDFQRDLEAARKVLGESR